MLASASNLLKEFPRKNLADLLHPPLQAVPVVRTPLVYDNEEMVRIVGTDWCFFIQQALGHLEMIQ